MCGIYGYFTFSGADLAAREFAAMGRTLIHRGPDDVSEIAVERAGIGARRLSIQDVEAGRQPFLSDDGRLIVAQNGEIYNFVELRNELEREGWRFRTRCDTEVILRLFERDGVDFVSRLNGMFAIAIYDARAQRLHLFRDRVGVKPLFYAIDGGRLIFASEIKTLFAGGLAPKPAQSAILQFLSWNYVPPPLTAFEGVYHAPPGGRLTISEGGVETHGWWSLFDQAPDSLTKPDNWEQQIRDTLDDAVRLRLRSDVPVGALLSGGVDSSSVVAAMTRAAPDAAFPAFCLGFADQRFDERQFAQLAAERFGVALHIESADPAMIARWPETVWLCDQPHGDVSFMPTGLVSALARRFVSVVLTGDGGDELFAGYGKYRDFFSRPDVAAMDDAAFRAAYLDSISLFGQDALARLLRPEVDCRSSDLFTPAEDAFAAAKAAGWDRINQALGVDMTCLLPGNNLVKPDRMAMAVSLEARTPYLDWRMVELAFRIPGGLKLHDGETKYILKRALRETLGETLTYRPKQMFTVPIGEWFQGALKSFCGGMSERLLANPVMAPMLNPQEVRRLFENHLAGRENNTREVRALIALQLWTEVFFEGRDPTAPLPLSAPLSTQAC